MTRSFHRWAYVSLAGFSCALALWFWLRRSQADEFQAVPSEPVLDSASPSTEDSPTSPTMVLPESPSDAGSRALQTLSEPDQRISIIVQTQAGQPIDDVEITWTPLLEDWCEDHSTWQSTDWERIEAVTSKAIALSSGAYQIEPPSVSSSRGSVIWITHPSFLARSVFVPTGKERWSIPSRLILKPSDGLRVTVRSPFDSQEDVVVYDGPSVEWASTDKRTAVSRRVLRRTRTPDAKGHASIGALPGRQWIVAVQGDLQSGVWIGEHPAEVTLDLRRTFTAQGRVHAPVDALRGCRVSSRRHYQDVTTILDDRRVNEDGTWGPVSLPILEANQYSFRLEGGSWVAGEVYRQTPGPGEEVRVDFTPDRGIPLEVRVVGPDDSGLPGSTVMVQWFDDPNWMDISGTADENGKVLLASCPPGSIWLRAACPRHLMRLVGPIEFTEELEEPIRIQLDPAGRITGRCLFNDRPIRSFSVNYWWDDPRLAQAALFEDRENGTFELDDVPFGEVSIFAFTDKHARSEARRVTVDGEKPGEVTLELRDPLRGFGRVIDGSTEEPLAHARIQLWNTYERNMVSPWGPEVFADSSGEFEIGGCLEGSNWIEVSMPGYSKVSRVGVGQAAGDVDFGSIPLLPVQDLHVQLILGEPIEPTACTVALDGPGGTGPRHFDASGLAVLPDIGPDEYQMIVTLPDGRPFYIDLDLQSGRDWYVEVPVPGDDLLDVEVVPAPGEELGRVDLEISYRLNDGSRVQYMIGTVDGRSRFLRPPSETAVIDVHGDQGILASKEFRPAEVSEPIRVLMGAPPRTFRVVSPDKEPLAGVQINLTLPGDVSGWYRVGTTGADGEYTFTGLSCESVLATLSNIVLGCRARIPVDLTVPADEVIELELDADAKISVLLLDGDVPLTGVPVRLIGARQIEGVFSEPVTDEHGVAGYEPVAEGRYLARIVHPGLWATDVEIEPSTTPVPVQVRRLGSVVITARRSGAALAGARIGLRSVEYECDVADWIEQGRVRVAPADGTTDGTGRTRFDGLPHGSYVWTVELDGGRPQGSLTVLPAQRVSASVDLP
jgi:hypothetical protein